MLDNGVPVNGSTQQPFFAPLVASLAHLELGGCGIVDRTSGIFHNTTETPFICEAICHM